MGGVKTLDIIFKIGKTLGKLGNEIILSDIHEISPNGKILRDLIPKYNLSVINAKYLCQGTFTRVNNKTLLKDQFLIILLYQKGYDLMFIQCILMKVNYLPPGEPSRNAKSFQVIMQLS